MYSFFSPRKPRRNHKQISNLSLPQLYKYVLHYSTLPSLPCHSLPILLTIRVMAPLSAAAVAAKREESMGFVGEMRAVAMKLHTRDQSKVGEKESDAPPLAKWEPTVEGYVQFLVDSKLVFDKLEEIVKTAHYPCYAEFRNTGLERSGELTRDLEWFQVQGRRIPEPSSPGIFYVHYLGEVSEKDSQAFICHLYNAYFGHAAGGRMIGKKVAEKILDKKELQFYKWEGQLSEKLQDAREKINQVAAGWTREEKDRCLEEMKISFNYYREIIHLILS